MPPRIAIIVTFFGQAPLWLPAFLLSCRENRDVNWLLYGDVEIDTPLPPNVAVKHMTARELGARASDALAAAIDVERSPRKLCDLKPAYGVVFADDLRGFGFWACSDLDIVWGDVRRFLNDDMLQAYDIVSSRLSRTSGHFTLFRNTPAINRTFELIPDFRQAMSTRHYEHLDERELTAHLRERLAGDPNGAPRVYWRQQLTMSAEYQRELGDGAAGALRWRRGRTFDASGRELMYLHFHKLKASMTSIDFGLADAPAEFTITRRGFSAAQPL